MEYIIGVDPAGGGSDGDYACAQVIERSSGMQCAELRGHYTPNELAARVAILGREYNQALVAVERNNHGYAVLAQLAMRELPEPVRANRTDGVVDVGGVASADAGELRGGAVERSVFVRQSAAVGGVQNVCQASGWNVGGGEWVARRHGDGHGNCAGGEGGGGGGGEELATWVRWQRRGAGGALPACDWVPSWEERLLKSHGV